MTVELTWLTYSALLTAVIWVPYILNRFVEMGPIKAVANPDADPTPTAAWAKRMMHAHRNAVENLVVFAPLVLGLAVAGISTSGTVLAAKLYFFARLGHVLVFTLGIPFARTVMFLVGFGCQVVLALALLGAA